jgi:hypothetical protein
LEYVLFVDESNWDAKNHLQNFQIAGFWGPTLHRKRKDILEEYNPLATRLITRCCEESGLSPEAAQHANKAKRRGQFASFAQLFFEGLPAEWQQVRIVNSNRIDFKDPDTNYTMTLAQLIIHVEEEIASRPDPGPLHLVAARIMKPGKSTNVYTDEIQLSAHKQRIRIERNIARFRQESSTGNSDKSIPPGEIHISSARTEPALIVCDWISYCSHTDFTPLRDERAEEALRAARVRLTDHVFDPSSYRFHIHQMISEGRLGEAVLLLAHLDREDELLETVLLLLAELPAHKRDPQLATLLSQWELLVETARSADALSRMNTHHEKILLPLHALLAARGKSHESTLEPLFYAYHMVCLETCNHHGDLVTAAIHRKEIIQRSPSLAGRWDQVNLLLEGHIRIAVHDTDRFETADALDRMKSFDQFVDGVGSLFHTELPEIFPEIVRSDVRGKLLGTWLQAVADNILVDPPSADRARELSDSALIEFNDPDHISRQQQYRSQIESLAGDPVAARDWLGRSLGLGEGASHEDLGKELDSLAVKSQKHSHLFFPIGFGLLHWSRIASRSAIRDPESQEAAEFRVALKGTSELRKHSWLTQTDGLLDYPAHGIRRYISAISAATDQESNALSMLRSIRYLASFDGSDRGRPLFDLFLTTGQCECAVIFARNEKFGQARTLLVGDDPGFRGAIPRLKSLARELEETDGLEAIQSYVTEFIDRASAAAEQLESPRASEIDALALHSQRFSH